MKSGRRRGSQGAPHRGRCWPVQEHKNGCPRFFPLAGECFVAHRRVFAQPSGTCQPLASSGSAYYAPL